MQFSACIIYTCQITLVFTNHLSLAAASCVQLYSQNNSSRPFMKFPLLYEPRHACHLYYIYTTHHLQSLLIIDFASQDFALL